MLLAVHRVCSWGTLVQLGVLVREDEPYVDLWVLLLDEHMFGSVLDRPDALRLDKEKAPRLWELKVRRILRLSRWDRVLDPFGLVLKFNTSVFDLLTDPFL